MLPSLFCIKIAFALFDKVQTICRIAAKCKLYAFAILVQLAKHESPGFSFASWQVQRCGIHYERGWQRSGAV